MKEKDAYKLVDILIKTGIHEIDILGGEPMLIPWMEDFIKYATGLNITLNISTNGSLPDVVNDFAEIQSDSVNIGFSVHGFSKIHNALTGADNFSKAIAGIERLIAAGKDPIVKSTLMKENKNEIYDLILYLRELGVKRYYLLHEDIIGRQISAYFSFPDFWEFYLKLRTDLKRILDIGFVAASGFYKYGVQAQGRCDAGTTKIAIMPDGSTFPCNLFFGLNEFCLGNIFKDSIENIWNNRILSSFRISDKNSCSINNCIYYCTCSGGCPAHSYYFYGALDRTDPRCEFKNHKLS
jgi:radical SAM protein with 4Fe4S-binding SPASM domain